MRHGRAKRPTMYLAGMDIKTVFDVARPRHIARMMGDQDVHGWITAAVSREMVGLEGHARFENVESAFSFCEMHSPGKRGSP